MILKRELQMWLNEKKIQITRDIASSMTSHKNVFLKGKGSQTLILEILTTEMLHKLSVNRKFAMYDWKYFSSSWLFKYFYCHAALFLLFTDSCIA